MRLTHVAACDKCVYCREVRLKGEVWRQMSSKQAPNKKAGQFPAFPPGLVQDTRWSAASSSVVGNTTGSVNV